MVAAPHEQARQIEAMVGVQMRQQHVDRTGVGVPLQRTQHTATEVDYQRRGIRRPKQIARCGRIRTDHTARAAEHGYSHGHYCAMPNSTMEKTSPLWCDQNL